MTLITLKTPLLWPASNGAVSSDTAFTLSGDLVDAAGEYLAHIFQADEDMTISHVGWRNGTVSGSPTADVRIETVDGSGLPSGTLWAANTNLVTGTLTANTWNLNALTASASITKGQFWCVKIAYNSGTSFQVGRTAGATWQPSQNANFWRVLNQGTPTISNVTLVPFMAVGNSATTFHMVEGMWPVSTFTSTTFASGSSPNRYGLRFQVPFKGRLLGASFLSSQVGNFTLAVHDDAGTLLESIAVDGDYPRYIRCMNFDTSVSITKNTWYRVSVEATTVTNQMVQTFTLPSSSYTGAIPWGAFGHLTTWNGSAWDDTNTTIIPIMNLAFDQIDDGEGAGGSAGGAHILGGTVVR